MHAPIWLKFGIGIGGLKANTSIKFRINLINIQAVIGESKVELPSHLQGKPY